MAESRWGRLGAASGIVFAVLFVLGVILPELPSGGASDASVAEFYADSGNRVTAIIAVYLLTFAGLAFLAFTASLYRGLRQAEGDSGSLAQIALGGGIIFVAMLYGASSAWGNVPAGIEMAGEAQPSSEIAIWFTQLGYGSLLLHAMFAAIAMIVPTSVLVLRTAVLPRWLAWTGFVCAAILVLGVVFIPMIALPIWTLATSIAMLKSRVPNEAQVARPVVSAA